MPPIRFETWPTLPALVKTVRQPDYLPVLCSFALFLAIAATWRYFRQRSIRRRCAILREEDLKTALLMEEHQVKYFEYLPPPPGSIHATPLFSKDDIFGLLNSGHLAARAERDREASEGITQTTEAGPWRRPSHALASSAINDKPRDVLGEIPASSADFVKHDIIHRFTDADLNGTWRRRIIEFEGCQLPA